MREQIAKTAIAMPIFFIFLSSLLVWSLVAGRPEYREAAVGGVAGSVAKRETSSGSRKIFPFPGWKN
ncbi:MAG: hypothetical protein WBB46_12230 [Candidatus Deferrimicrobiaceae bacterium]